MGRNHFVNKNFSELSKEISDPTHVSMKTEGRTDADGRKRKGRRPSFISRLGGGGGTKRQSPPASLPSSPLSLPTLYPPSLPLRYPPSSLPYISLSRYAIPLWYSAAVPPYPYLASFLASLLHCNVVPWEHSSPRHGLQTRELQIQIQVSLCLPLGLSQNIHYRCTVEINNLSMTVLQKRSMVW